MPRGGLRKSVAGSSESLFIRYSSTDGECGLRYRWRMQKKRLLVGMLRNARSQHKASQGNPKYFEWEGTPVAIRLYRSLRPRTSHQAGTLSGKGRTGHKIKILRAKVSVQHTTSKFHGVSSKQPTPNLSAATFCSANIIVGLTPEYVLDYQINNLLWLRNSIKARQLHQLQRPGNFARQRRKPTASFLLFLRNS